MIRAAGTDVLVGYAESKNKTGTSGLDIKCGTFAYPQSMLKQTGCAGKYSVWRPCSYNNQIDIVRLETGRVKRLAGGDFRHTRGRLMLGSYAALADAGSFDNPVIRGIYRP
jgi:hypothetical protein